MKISISLLLSIALSACVFSGAAQPNENILVTGFPDIPSDARDVAERLASCHHFWGEIGGDNSERDREVNATLSQLRCETIEVETAAIRSKYEKNKAVQDALDQAENW